MTCPHRDMKALTKGQKDLAISQCPIGKIKISIFFFQKFQKNYICHIDCEWGPWTPWNNCVPICKS